MRTQVGSLGRDCVNPALRVGPGLGGGREGEGTQSRPTQVIAVLPLLRPQEFEVIAQIKLLQSACNNYSIEPEEQFGAWFRATQRLSETDR